MATISDMATMTTKLQIAHIIIILCANLADLLKTSTATDKNTDPSLQKLHFQKSHITKQLILVHVKNAASRSLYQSPLKLLEHVNDSLQSLPVFLEVQIRI